jgi:hypothetical protein
MLTTFDRQANLVVAQSQAVGSAEPWLKVIGSQHLVDWLIAEEVSLAFQLMRPLPPNGNSESPF